MDKTEITWTISITDCAVFSRVHMARLELVILARTCEIDGVVVVSRMLSQIKYQPCFLPCPTLVTISPSRFWLIRSMFGPWTSLAIVLYYMMLLSMVGLV